MGEGQRRGKLMRGTGVTFEGCGRESNGEGESFVLTMGDGGRIDDAMKNGLSGESDGGGESFISTMTTLCFNREKWTFFF